MRTKPTIQTTYLTLTRRLQSTSCAGAAYRAGRRGARKTQDGDKTLRPEAAGGCTIVPFRPR